MNKPKVLAVVGPTASGKSALAVEIARHFDGEIISADSRQVYRGLDIGSGKITPAEMKGALHHLLDIADPMDNYTGADFVKDAKLAISDILSRGKLPIIAGGTFFYIELLKGASQAAPVKPNPALRAKLEELTTEQLFQKLQILDKDRAENIDKFNRRRMIRSLEIIDALGEVPKIKKFDSPYDWLTIGIDISKSQLESRIENRLNERLNQGMVEEVKTLLESGVDSKWLCDLGLEYRYLTEYLQNKITLEEMKILIKTKSRQFAKRQLTWLKRDRDIIWKPFPVGFEEVKSELKLFYQ